ncbi:monocarboxylate transporter 13-like [Oscarella lobularis]|uniref:monocarboxylate transporter 13-like n=1 Tax=Oscarella lobularis TaxID=121494 RepID=UPI003313432E
MTAAKGKTYRWPIIVCIAAFVAFFLLGGIMYATGVLFSELLKVPCDVKRPMHNASAERDTSSSTCGTSNVTSRCDNEREVQWTNVSQTANDANATEECGGFGESRGKTAWVSSVHLAAGRLFGILAAILIDRFGCRTVAVIGSALAALGCLASSFASSLILFICLYSLISGVGYALLFTSSVVIVQQHWRPLGYLPIANGFALAGMGVGAIAFGPISRAFIGNYDWRSYLLFLAAAFAVVLGLSLLYKAPTTEADTKKKKRKIFNVALLKSPSVVLFMVAVILMFLGLSAPFVHMVRFALDLCSSQAEADYLVTYFGIGSLVGRVVVGFIGNHRRVQPVYLYLICLVCASASVYCAPLIQTYAGLAAFASAYGFFLGGILSFAYVTLGSIVTKEQVPQAAGWYMCSQGPSNVISAPIAGWIYDGTCSYSIAFYLSGTTFALSSGVMFIVAYIERRKRRNEEMKKCGNEEKEKCGNEEMKKCGNEEKEKCEPSV